MRSRSCEKERNSAASGSSGALLTPCFERHYRMDEAVRTCEYRLQRRNLVRIDIGLRPPAGRRGFCIPPRLAGVGAEAVELGLGPGLSIDVAAADRLEINPVLRHPWIRFAGIVPTVLWAGELRDPLGGRERSDCVSLYADRRCPEGIMPGGCRGGKPKESNERLAPGLARAHRTAKATVSGFAAPQTPERRLESRSRPVRAQPELARECIYLMPAFEEQGAQRRVSLHSSN